MTERPATTRRWATIEGALPAVDSRAAGSIRTAGSARSVGSGRSARRAAARVGRLAVAVLLGLAAGGRAADDGTQLASPFRANYVGYFQHGPKIARYLSAEGGTKAWALRDAAGKVVGSGTSRDHVAGDFASGDSFFRIDFSSFAGPGTGVRLTVDGKDSAPFDVAATSPYGRLAVTA